MNNTKLMETIKQMLGQITKEELGDLKKEITESHLRIDKLETKLRVAYDELARNKEDFTRIASHIQ